MNECMHGELNCGLTPRLSCAACRSRNCDLPAIIEVKSALHDADARRQQDANGAELLLPEATYGFIAQFDRG